MAKRVAKKGKPKQYKRETNAQRAAREDERRTTQMIANALAVIISKKGRMPPGMDIYVGDEARSADVAWSALIHRIKLLKGKVTVAAYPKPRSKSTLRFTLLHAPADVGDSLVKKPEIESLRETYILIGREICEFNGNVSEFLRLVADKIEGKRPSSSGENWYDGAIGRAYLEACCLSGTKHWDAILAGVLVPPTFSEFRDIFRRQNPNLRGVPDRSLRRSLRRLGQSTRPEKRGRPKE
jgi:hypothetical protein